MAEVRDSLAQLREQWSGASQLPDVIVTGGTATTAAAVLLALPTYMSERVHGSCMQRTALLSLAGRMRDAEGRAHAMAQFAWLTRARADMLAPGCCVLLALLDELGVASVRVSDRDLLDGLLACTQSLVGGDGIENGGAEL